MCTHFAEKKPLWSSVILKLQLFRCKARILDAREIQCSPIYQAKRFANTGDSKIGSRSKQNSRSVFAEKAVGVVFDEGGSGGGAILAKGAQILSESEVINGKYGLARLGVQ